MLTIRYRQVSGRLEPGGAGDAAENPRSAFSPPVDISYRDGLFIVRVDIAGASAEDITIEACEHELAIYGSIRAADRTGSCRLMERRSGQFRRVLTFPGKITPEGIDASLQQGVLILRIPTSDLEIDPTEIKIEIQGAD